MRIALKLSSQVLDADTQTLSVPVVTRAPDLLDEPRVGDDGA